MRPFSTPLSRRLGLTYPLVAAPMFIISNKEMLLACAEAGIEVAEERIPVGALESADEVWVSNAVIGMVPVSGILGVRRELSGEGGATLAAVRSAYREHLARAAAARPAGT